MVGGGVRAGWELRLGVGRVLTAWGGPLGALAGAFISPFTLPDGIHPTTHAAMLSLLDKERKGVAPLLPEYSSVRAACLFTVAKDAVTVLPPVVMRPGATKSPQQIKVEEAAMARATLEQVAGCASDPEVALQLQCMDLDVFRYEDEKRRPIPGLEIVQSLPLDLAKLSVPFEDEEEDEDEDEDEEGQGQGQTVAGGGRGLSKLLARREADNLRIQAMFAAAKTVDADAQMAENIRRAQQKKKEEEERLFGISTIQEEKGEEGEKEEDEGGEKGDGEEDEEEGSKEGSGEESEEESA